ncbi:MBOAT family O-acyltransferase [Paenibacillus thermoaerophilus]|uniref:MBOAT family O-acyltransferase n=1 Tax=Paenibacillus thermoaerophilus TaxID=1215385 RepID=A0ABW2V3K4_9BACL|nr:MBOAT family O-acyltransferase [Paenibacillus thermoaerophilus]TMV08258.1 MBOAT family protein [Paenibacillus thermoaerophilus]
MFYLNMNAVAALAGLILLLFVTRRWSGGKRWLLLAFNLAFLAVFSLPLAGFYAVYSALNYAGYVWLRTAERGRRAGFAVLCFANIGVVVTARLLDMNVWEHPLYDPIMTLGLIYNLLKAIDTQYFAYYVGRNHPRASALDYFNYILFVPTFTSGPILKFRDFLADARQPHRVDAAGFETAVKRIILGFFKKIVLVTWMYMLYDHLMAGELYTWTSLFLMVWFYLIIYFDFSGYSDIAIGFGRLTGYNVPENFKQPFLSPTLTQYWRNWHATMADWFRDHVTLIFARRNTTKRTAVGLSMLIMLLIGLWHGFTWLYVLWGLYHGLVMAAEILLDKTTVNKKKVSKAYYYARCLLTQAIVAAAVIVYIPDTEQTLRIYAGLLNWP